MLKNIYILSGLGADERAFKHIDIDNAIVHHINWIKPKKNESLPDYSLGLITQIKDKNPILLGLSFGGIVAIEIAKQLETEKIILISSVKTKNEIPLYIRASGILRLHKILPSRLLKSSNSITNWFFGVKTKDDKALLKNILNETDLVFLKWAIDKIVNWENQFMPSNSIHIHGTSDKILLHKNVSCDFPIDNGGHLMILDKYYEINKILNRII